jgi:hypothetical protein
MQERPVAPALVDIYTVLLKGTTTIFIIKKYNILLWHSVVFPKIVFSFKLNWMIDLPC